MACLKYPRFRGVAGVVHGDDPFAKRAGDGMTGKQKREIASKMPGGDLLRRLQGLLYEYHGMGRFEEARPHILWLMEIAEAAHRTAPPVSQMAEALSRRA
jgi:hypothetical protein